MRYEFHPEAEQELFEAAWKYDLHVTGLGCRFADEVHERVSAAREMLEAGRIPVAQIGERAGFGSQESFRRHFRLRVGASPGAYQRRFLHAAR